MSQDRQLPSEGTMEPDGKNQQEARKVEQAFNAVAQVADGEDILAQFRGTPLSLGALRQAVEKRKSERNWDRLYFLLEFDQMRRRIEELNQLIEQWNRENEGLRQDITALQKVMQESRQKEQELKRAAEKRDFARDPETGRFVNQTVEQAVADYEKRFGAANRDQPEMLLLILQWAQQQEHQIRSDWQLQLDDKTQQIQDNNRKIEAAEKERDELEASLPQGEFKHAGSIQKTDLEAREVKEQNADRLLVGSENSDASGFKDGSDLDFLGSPAADDLATMVDNTPVAKTASAKDSGGIRCAIDLGTEFAKASHDVELTTVRQPDAAPAAIQTPSSSFKPV